MAFKFALHQKVMIKKTGEIGIITSFTDCRIDFNQYCINSIFYRENELTQIKENEDDN